MTRLSRYDTHVGSRHSETRVHTEAHRDAGSAPDLLRPQNVVSIIEMRTNRGDRDGEAPVCS